MQSEEAGFMPEYNLYLTEDTNSDTSLT